MKQSNTEPKQNFPLQSQLKRHQEKITKYLKDQKAPKFEIISHATPQRGIQVVDWTKLTPTYETAAYLSFVPAAGMGSRYLSPLENLLQALRERDMNTLSRALAEVPKSWILPKRLANLVEAKEAKLSSQECQDLLQSLSIPKALFPAHPNGSSFLQLKKQEASAIGQLAANLFVVTPEHLDAIKKDSEKQPCDLDTDYLLQDENLSTARFELTGEMIRDTAGEPSLVPGGHGRLRTLFGQIAEGYPKASGLFIRNIDNVIGTGSKETAISKSFLQLHYVVLDQLRLIRKALQAEELEQAANFVDELYAIVPPSQTTNDQKRVLEHTSSKAEQKLWHAILSLWHTPSKLYSPDPSRLRQLYERPLNILGQVRRSPSDKGGIPVFARTPLGEHLLCIESCHVDQKDPTLSEALYFNPVFVAAELSKHQQSYDQTAEAFWTISQKHWQGRDVLYHEELLYEMLGNSHSANCLFVEIPRSLFNPHKDIRATANH